jgi:flagellum-specific peptidoglycan hydrolase FlgJ
MEQSHDDFLYKAFLAANAAGHVFPEHAACEAALESGWGQSRLALEANNLFGQKQSHPPVKGTETLVLPTEEYVKKQWVTVSAKWVKFSRWQDCFKARMDLLERLSDGYPHYAAALVARTGDDFAREVSISWSTDPQRAAKVVAIHSAHQATLRRRINGAQSEAARV